MFIKLNHQSLDIYSAIRELTKEIYQISTKLPAEEKFNMVPQMRSAGLSVKLNLCEGSSRRSATERKIFYEISRGSLIELDAILETAVDMAYFRTEDLETVGTTLNKCFAMLSNMMK
jgi:four helix bundle protein